MKPSTSWIPKTLAVICVLVTAVAALAESYPSRTIRLLVPQVAGSTTDIIARAVGAELAKDLGQAIVIDNKVGAGGSIAMAELSHAPTDGYTLGFVTQGMMVFNLSLYAKVGYDPVKDFAPIGMVGGVSNVLIVPPGSEARSVMDLVAKARAKPGSLTYSSGGTGTSHHLSGVLFSQLMGIDLLHVPYKGAPQGTLAVMSGEVDMAFYNTPSVLTQIRAHKVKALAVTSKAPSRLLVDLPTMDNSGVKGYEVNTWFGAVAPAGVPPEIVARLSRSLQKVMAMPELRDVLAPQGVDIAKDQTPAAFSRILASDLATWPAVIKASGARAD